MNISSDNFIQVKTIRFGNMEHEWKYSLIGPHVNNDALEVGVCYNVGCFSYYAFIDLTDKISSDIFKEIKYDYKNNDGYHRYISENVVAFLSTLCIKRYIPTLSMMFFIGKIQSWTKEGYKAIKPVIPIRPYINHEDVDIVKVSRNDWRSLGMDKSCAYVKELDLSRYTKSPIQKVKSSHYIPTDYSNGSDSPSYTIEIIYLSSQIRKYVEKVLEMLSIRQTDSKVWDKLHDLKLISSSVYSSHPW